MSPEDLAKALRDGAALTILDVRERDEIEIAALPGALHIPMQQVPARMAELDRSGAIVVACHHGIRSAMVVGFLRREGFASVHNLEGGIDAWSTEVDPSVPRY